MTARAPDLIAAPPRVAHANRYPFRPGEIAGPHASRSELVLPVLDGRGAIAIGGVEFRVAAGDVVLVPWDAPVRYAADRARPFAVIGIHLVPRPWRAPAPGMPRHAARALAEGARARRPRGALWRDAFLVADREAVIADTAGRIVDAFEARDPDREPRLRALAALLASDVRAARARADLGGAHPLAARVREAMEWMTRSAGRPIRRAEIARRVGVGETALAEAFRAVVGQAPIDWLIDLRLDRARALLRDTRDPIAAVGAAVGIHDPYYFSRLFRRRAGCSPRAYRDRHRFGGA